MNVIGMEKCAIPLMSIIKTHNLSADVSRRRTKTKIKLVVSLKIMKLLIPLHKIKCLIKSLKINQEIYELNDLL